MQLFRVQAPPKLTLNGMAGRVMFKDNVSELLSLRECQLIQAHVGGRILTTDTGILDVEDIETMAPYGDVVMRLVDALDEDDCELRLPMLEAFAEELQDRLDATRMSVESLDPEDDDASCACGPDEACSDCAEAPAESTGDTEALAALVAETDEGGAPAVMADGRSSDAPDTEGEQPADDVSPAEPLSPAVVEAVAEENGVELPHYNDMRAALAAAAEEGVYDYRALIGSSRSADDTRKAYLALQLVLAADDETAENGG